MKLCYRQARKSDIRALVDLLHNDALGATREDKANPLNPAYLKAFQNIQQDSNNELTVVEYEGELVGMLQLTFIPYLTHTGAWRCLIEGVRVHSNYRGQGLGAHVFNWAIERAKQKGCAIVQLTSDKQRPDAIRFYQTLGFRATHEGFKLVL